MVHICVLINVLFHTHDVCLAQHSLQQVFSYRRSVDWNYKLRPYVMHKLSRRAWTWLSKINVTSCELMGIFPPDRFWPLLSQKLSFLHSSLLHTFTRVFLTATIPELILLWHSRSKSNDFSNHILCHTLMTSFSTLSWFFNSSERSDLVSRVYGRSEREAT